MKDGVEGNKTLTYKEYVKATGFSIDDMKKDNFKNILKVSSTMDSENNALFRSQIKKKGVITLAATLLFCRLIISFVLAAIGYFKISKNHFSLSHFSRRFNKANNDIFKSSKRHVKNIKRYFKSEETE